MENMIYKTNPGSRRVTAVENDGENDATINARAIQMILFVDYHLGAHPCPFYVSLGHSEGRDFEN